MASGRTARQPHGRAAGDAEKPAAVTGAERPSESAKRRPPPSWTQPQTHPPPSVGTWPTYAGTPPMADAGRCVVANENGALWT
eukprot:7761463-Alexandrium_andersonii.AAC.1